MRQLDLEAAARRGSIQAGRGIEGDRDEQGRVGPRDGRWRRESSPPGVE